MTTITKTITVDYAHALHLHNGKCRGIHGHTAHITIALEGTPSPIMKGTAMEGMLLDYGTVKAFLKESIEETFDHKLILCKDDERLSMLLSHVGVFQNILRVEETPTAENLAKLCFQILKEKFNGFAKVKFVEWCETPTSSARYEE
jgi:6-pyruvoyltetrahydropterin/6-carboxytetrahydropterin synthase